MARHVSCDQLARLQTSPGHVHNICIVAHVDHGKTTLADALVASNGVISQRSAGSLRYLDSRPDEQSRGITMKSSAIALCHVPTSRCPSDADKSPSSRVADDPADVDEQSDTAPGGTEAVRPRLVNLIDSPGHVDFSGEVSTAVRLCDGAVVVVDVVEGVCAQTRLVLQQTWSAGLKPVLVLNKMDRLVLEMSLTPLDAYQHLVQVLEAVNAVMAELCTADHVHRASGVDRPAVGPEGAVDRPAVGPGGVDRPAVGPGGVDRPAVGPEGAVDSSTRDISDWSLGLDELDDSTLYFSPDAGNVLFASAFDGWGFDVGVFADLYSRRLGMSRRALLRTLWGDYYLHAKSRRILPGAQARAKQPLFAQLVLTSVWSVYEAIVTRPDPQRRQQLLERLGLQLHSRDLRGDVRTQLRTVMSQWLPLADGCLDMVVHQLPSAAAMTPQRAERLLAPTAQLFGELPAETRQLREALTACSSADDAPLIVYVSKMIGVEPADLPQNRARPLTALQLSERRAAARSRHAQLLANPADTTAESGVPMAAEQQQQVEQVEQTDDSECQEVFIGFARVLSGCLREDSEVYVLDGRHDPAAGAGRRRSRRCRVSGLYLLMGRCLERLERAPAGSLVGVGGLQQHVLRSATLSSTLHCPAFVDALSASSTACEPLVRVAVEPARPSQLPRLLAGLRLLHQADPSVRVSVQESGEHVVAASGEVHLQRCLDDLRQRFSRIQLSVSQPIVPFRETVVRTPRLDMVQEAVQTRPGPQDGDHSMHTFRTCGGAVEFGLQAVPLPDTALQLLDSCRSMLSAAHRRRRKQLLSTRRQSAGAGSPAEDGSGSDGALEKNDTEKSEKLAVECEAAAVVADLDDEEEMVGCSADPEAVRGFCEQLTALLRLDSAAEVWCDGGEQVWAVGPRYCGSNVLLNCSVASGPRLWEQTSCADSAVQSAVVHGFQLAALAGPLCEEPMRGVCFLLRRLELSDPAQLVTGQLISAVREACRSVVRRTNPRLQTAMYRCEVRVESAALGRLYGVLGRRSGQVVQADLQEGSDTFCVTAHIPVVESFQLADQLRKETSGLAQPQLVFSHWETLEVDPYWTPTTDTERLHYGDKADTENRARAYMNAVRRRKGLLVDQQIVQHAEKQRTLARKK